MSLRTRPRRGLFGGAFRLLLWALIGAGCAYGARKWIDWRKVGKTTSAAMSSAKAKAESLLADETVHGVADPSLVAPPSETAIPDPPILDDDQSTVTGDENERGLTKEATEIKNFVNDELIARLGRVAGGWRDDDGKSQTHTPKPTRSVEKMSSNVVDAAQRDEARRQERKIVSRQIGIINELFQ